MRVIAGKARRLLLKTIEGNELRPTTDRIKETLFNIVNPGLMDSLFLDLFAGTGGIGIEAISRGARLSVFVESNRAAAECIGHNLVSTKLEKEGIVMNCDALTGLRRLQDKGYVFDYIFMDPPYGKELERSVLQYLPESGLISPDTVIIVEADLKTGFDYVEDSGLFCLREKLYKSNKHVFFAMERERTGGAE